MRPIRSRYFLSLLACALGLPPSVQAQPWTSRAGARALALGEAAGTAMPGSEGQAYNPALVPDDGALLLSHTFWVQDFSADHALAALPWGPVRVGLDLGLEQALGVEQRDAYGRWLGVGTVARQSAGLAAALPAGPWRLGLRAGAETLQGLAAGAQGEWGAGLAWAGPWGLSAGAAADLSQGLWRGRAAALLTPSSLPQVSVAAGYLGDGADARTGVGLEWAPSAWWAVRGGWQFPAQPSAATPAGPWSVGVGVHLSQGDLDYSLLDLGSLGQAHRLQWRSDLAFAGAARRSSPAPAPTSTPAPPAAVNPTATTPAPAASPSPTPTPTPGRRAVPLRFVIPAP